MKPFSEACVQNQAEICAVLKNLLDEKKHLLEIGSGTGQHAVYFAKHLPHLIWHTSDQTAYHHGIQMWLDEADLENTRNPIALDVSEDRWPTLNVDAIFSANSVHIMSWKNVIDYVRNGAKLLENKGLFILYGPFNYNGEYTSPSNASFDQWLKARDHKSGIRDYEHLNTLAEENGMTLKHDIEMAVNNRILCWEKTH